MSKIVVDANVAIKLVLPEIYSSAALKLRNINYELLVPDFFFPEIGNILWKRVRRSEMISCPGDCPLLNWFLGSAWEPRSRGSASLGDRRGRASRRHS